MWRFWCGFLVSPNNKLLDKQSSFRWFETQWRPYDSGNVQWSVRHSFLFSHMMTSSNGNIFRVTGPLCGEFTAPGDFPTQRPVTRSFDVFFNLRLNKRLSKQPWGWWFETPSWSLWRQCNEYVESDNALSCQWNRSPLAQAMTLRLEQNNPYL